MWSTSVGPPVVATAVDEAIATAVGEATNPFSLCACDGGGGDGSIVGDDPREF